MKRAIAGLNGKELSIDLEGVEHCIAHVELEPDSLSAQVAQVSSCLPPDFVAQGISAEYRV